MDKHTARGLAIGLFFTAMILIVFKPMLTINQEAVATYLEENDLIAISKEELRTIEQIEPIEQIEQSTVEVKDSSKYEPTEMVSKNDNEQEHKVPTNNQENKPEDKIFSITKGMVSSDVAYELKKNKLIKNQGEFIKMLESKNGAKYIQIGEYKLNSSMSNEEIISVITRNRVI